MNTTKERWREMTVWKWSSTRTRENGAKATEEIMAKKFLEPMKGTNFRALDFFPLYERNIKSPNWLSPALKVYISKNQSSLKVSFLENLMCIMGLFTVSAQTSTTLISSKLLLKEEGILKVFSQPRKFPRGKFSYRHWHKNRHTQEWDKIAQK